MDSEKATWSVNTLSPDRTRLLFQHGQQALVERIGTAHRIDAAQPHHRNAAGVHRRFCAARIGARQPSAPSSTPPK